MILADLLVKESSAGHAWEAFRSGIQCRHCKLRYHTKNMLEELKDANERPCEKAPRSTPPRQTRMEMIHALVASQQAPQPGIHHLKLDRAYLRCSECKSYILARTNEDAFTKFVAEPCLVGPVPADEWPGHGSHTMMRKGSALECSRCHSRARLVNGEIKVTARLAARCVFQRNKDLRQMFS